MIRHAPVISDGLFYGSRDVACRCPNTQEAKKIVVEAIEQSNQLKPHSTLLLTILQMG